MKTHEAPAMGENGPQATPVQVIDEPRAALMREEATTIAAPLGGEEQPQ